MVGAEPNAAPTEAAPTEAASSPREPADAEAGGLLVTDRAGSNGALTDGDVGIEGEAAPSGWGAVIAGAREVSPPGPGDGSRLQTLGELLTKG